MSLFGTSPDEPPAVATPSRLSKSSLFDDEPTHHRSGSALFADDSTGGDSPWDMPTPKKAGQQNLVKNLLPTSDVPESYVDAYELVVDAGNRVGAGIGLTAIREILSSSGLNAADQSKILNLILPGGQEPSNCLGRNEFNVLLALVGLAQEGEDLTYDAIDERRHSLPKPKISYLNDLKSSSQPAPPSQPQEEPSPSKPQPQPATPRQSSFGASESDPWGSPDLHRGHNHTSAPSNEPTLNGFGGGRSATNGWTANSTTTGPETNAGVPTNGQAPPSSSGSGWSGYNNNTNPPFGSAGPSGLDGFGGSGGGQDGSNFQSRAIGSGRATGSAVEEVITITLLSEKEGVFMFQHRNYEVKSARRGSSVVRRYSDFVWLLDCLQKRYPFRQLPLLPPKRVSVNGTHLSADSNSFLEKRRRGLVRFSNALVRHPVLSQEQLVVMFLTVPTELSVWRKQATISVQEEFTGRALPPDLEDSLPPTLNETFDTVRSGVKRSAEIYINLCALLERLAKRNEGLAADHLRFSLALQSLTEATNSTYAVDTNDVPLLNEGINATARHLSTSQSLLEDEAKAWSEGVLEDLKRQRDCLVSMRDLFDRRDRYAKDNIPQLEKRIESNEKKLQDLRARPQGTVKPGEIEKIEESIFKDKESIVQQHARGVFIKECIRDELTYFQQSQYHISRLHQDWSQERVKYAELQADNWRNLSEEVEGMPNGD
ncbi:sorting nexin Mvp1 [Talaromyces proteolyticus]|uniref:Sorting nexin MVP1 n=1 Tax=Talaromyces proteolyticus TaxID=1131652 RepID=A0AAD4L7B2_9EURO|nr:sorting nexin Mvp1 [Talaromyces proteolyticus]KAH8705289.1 sorting nexin Mvp1 [Talaromyces proteolyticus]